MIKFAARVGMIGPILFGGVLITLTIFKYDFLNLGRFDDCSFPGANDPFHVNFCPVCFIE